MHQLKSEHKSQIEDENDATSLDVRSSAGADGLLVRGRVGGAASAATCRGTEDSRYAQSYAFLDVGSSSLVVRSRAMEPARVAPDVRADAPGEDGINLTRGIAKKTDRANCGAFPTRLLSNLFGLSHVGARWAMAKVEGKGLADSAGFCESCEAMLKLNGIEPTIVYENDKHQVEAWPTCAEAQKSILRDAPLFVVNHVSYIDTVLLPVVLNMPKFVSKSEIKSWPVFGDLGQDLGYVWVDRDSKGSRLSTVNAIKNHVKGWQLGDRPLVLFPEGTTSSGEGLLEFKKGAFVSGKPVRPIVLKYTGLWDPSNPDFREADFDHDAPADQVLASDNAGKKRLLVRYSDKDWMWQFAGQKSHPCVVLVCARYDPSPEEQADANLYAENVKAFMLQRLQELNKVFDKRGDSCDRAVARLRDSRRRKAMRDQDARRLESTVAGVAGDAGLERSAGILGASGEKSGTFTAAEAAEAMLVPISQGIKTKKRR